jgi:hypothetical protein
MPPEAYALVVTFAVVAVASGLLAAAVVGRVAAGPRGWRWAILPGATAFLTLYWVGHRLGLVAGPQVELFGFQVSVALDLGVALGSAFAMAALQVILVRMRRPAT